MGYAVGMAEAPRVAKTEARTAAFIVKSLGGLIGIIEIAESEKCEVRRWMKKDWAGGSIYIYFEEGRIA